MALHIPREIADSTSHELEESRTADTKRRPGFQGVQFRVNTPEHEQQESPVNVAGLLDAQGARQLAADLLAEALPRRWSHTIAVAKAAEDLSSALKPEGAEEIVCAAWLHDIGYAPDLIDTGFHPLDGAAYLARDAGGGKRISTEVISLVAHHTGAAFEARERGLHDSLADYPQPDQTKLAILSCADLCSGPAGAPVDPAERISEVLARYPKTHPVHRAITKSAPTLVAQSRRVLEAARERTAVRWSVAPEEDATPWGRLLHPDDDPHRHCIGATADSTTPSPIGGGQ